MFKITFNSPLILAFTAICVGTFVLDQYVFNGLNKYLTLSPYFDWNIHTYFTAPIAHGSMEHLMGNLTFILLLGPLLEWKYNTKELLILMLITAVVTGVLNKIFFPTGLIGASGIVFLFIILSSFTNREKGIPLTFILVFLLFVGKEIMSSYKEDNISQFAHIIGGIVGAVAGFVIKPDSFKE